MVDPNNFRFSCMGPDNDLRIRRVIELFSKTEQQSELNPQLLDLDYWKSHTGSRFISINLFDERDLIAHFSLIPFPLTPNVMFLDHLVIDPEYSQHTTQICSATINHLEKMAARRKWHSLFAIPATQGTRAYNTYTEQLGFEDVGFCPQLYLREGLYSDETRLCSPLLYRNLLPECTQQSKESFLPSAHREIVSEILQTIGLTRSLKDETAVNVEYSALAPLCYDYVPQFSCLFLSSNTNGGVIDAKDLLQSLEKCGAGYVAFSPHSRAALASIEVLEKEDFSFCGYLPRMGDSDYLLYFRPNGIPKKLSDNAELWRSLFGRYMLQYKHQRVFFGLDSESEDKLYATA